MPGGDSLDIVGKVVSIVVAEPIACGINGCAAPVENDHMGSPVCPVHPEIAVATVVGYDHTRMVLS
jgi:hypothetical protein